MTTLIDLKCPNCGAGLPSPEPHSATTVCEYCQASIAVHHHDTPEQEIPTQGFHVRMPASNMVETPNMEASPQRRETPRDGELLREVIARQNAAEPSFSFAGCLVVWVLVVGLIGGIVGLVFFLKGKDNTRRKNMIAKSERESREREDKRLLDQYRRELKGFIQDRERSTEDIEDSLRKRIDALLTQKDYPIPFHGSATAKYPIIFFVPYVNHFADRNKSMELLRQKITKEHPGLFRWYIIPMGHKFYHSSLTQVAAFEILREKGAKAWWDYFKMFTRYADMGMPRTFQYILRGQGEPRDQKELYRELDKLKKGFLHKIRRTGIDANAFIAGVKAKKHKEITDKIREISVDLTIASYHYGGIILGNYIWKVGDISYRNEDFFGWIYPELNKKRAALLKRGLTPPKLP
ncbi:hypothetical protein KKF84_18295 [Myxococcota bacterium]|nr:hypothetical protein [Myxococcota bacterium]MBU1537274.1 hypothetical protein [Myxococcota bacterium]